MNWIEIGTYVLPFILELGLRLFPTKNPKSLFRMIATVCTVIAKSIDKIVPDRVS